MRRDAVVVEDADRESKQRLVTPRDESLGVSCGAFAALCSAPPHRDRSGRSVAFLLQFPVCGIQCPIIVDFNREVVIRTVEPTQIYFAAAGPTFGLFLA